MQISAFYARNRLGKLLDRAEQGEEILMARQGRQVARRMPLLLGGWMWSAGAAMAERIRIRATSATSRQSMDPE